MKLTALKLNPSHGNTKAEQVCLGYRGVEVGNSGDIKVVIRLAGEDNKSAVLTMENREEFETFHAAVNQLAQLVNWQVS